MKVIWLDAALTFRSETPEEDAALRAIWIAFGSQVPERYGEPRRIQEWKDESGGVVAISVNAIQDFGDE